MNKENSLSLAAATELGLTEDRVRLIHKMCGDGQLSDSELALFLNVCSQHELDPLMRQIYAIKRSAWNPTTRQKEMRMTIQIGIDGARLKAHRSGRYRGQTPFLWCGKDGEWVDVWLSSEPPRAARVEVHVEGYAAPVSHTVLFEAYVQTNRAGERTGRWLHDPAGMLAKCAEAGALRKAFPEQLGGLYTGDEMEQADNPIPVGKGSTIAVDEKARIHDQTPPPTLKPVTLAIDPVNEVTMAEALPVTHARRAREAKAADAQAVVDTETVCNRCGTEGDCACRETGSDRAYRVPKGIAEGSDRCEATTKAGNPCARFAVKNSVYCSVHFAAQPKQVMGKPPRPPRAKNGLRPVEIPTLPPLPSETSTDAIADDLPVEPEREMPPDEAEWDDGLKEQLEKTVFNGPQGPGTEAQPKGRTVMSNDGRHLELRHTANFGDQKIFTAGCTSYQLKKMFDLGRSYSEALGREKDKELLDKHFELAHRNHLTQIQANTFIDMLSIGIKEFFETRDLEEPGG